MKRASVSRRSKKVWTIGYEGRAIGQFLRVLRDSGIEQVIDVRQRPLSRKSGYSKMSLSHYLGKAAILYRHIPELGTPPALRIALKKGGTLKSLLDGYSRHLDKNEGAYRILTSLIRAKTSAILCFEKDYTQCHRQVLAERLEKDGFRLMHL